MRKNFLKLCLETDDSMYYNSSLESTVLQHMLPSLPDGFEKNFYEVNEKGSRLGKIVVNVIKEKDVTVFPNMVGKVDGNEAVIVDKLTKRKKAKAKFLVKGKPSAIVVREVRYKEAGKEDLSSKASDYSSEQSIDSSDSSGNNEKKASRKRRKRRRQVKRKVSRRF